MIFVFAEVIYFVNLKVRGQHGSDSVDRVFFFFYVKVRGQRVSGGFVVVCF